MGDMHTVNKRLNDAEVDVVRFIRKGPIRTALSYGETRKLVERLLGDNRINVRYLSRCMKALGAFAHQHHLAVTTKHPWKPSHVHKKSGGNYLKIGVGQVQNSSGKPLEEGDEVAVYQDRQGRLWVRRDSEFEDGRFFEL